jgi:hypothetical protein
MTGGIERDECWFLMCSRSPDGELHGENGFAVAACEKHGVSGESFGWKRFDRFGGEPDAE